MTLSRQQISLLAHADHPIASPFSDASVAGLLDQVPLSGGARVLDVGCGEGEWLARLAPRGLDLTGVDLSEVALARAAGKLGASARLVARPAGEFLANTAERWDLIMCNGSSHALGGFTAALATLAGYLAPGGAMLVSDGYWRAPPQPATLAALDMSEVDLPRLSQVLAAAEGAGLAADHLVVSTMAEWDDYEDAWCSALERHAAQAADAAEAEQLLTVAREHRAQYRDGYRGVLGYLGMVLRR